MYWLGPLLAGVVAGLLYDLVFAGNASVAKAKAFFTQSDYDDSQFGAPEAGPSAVVWPHCGLDSGPARQTLWRTA